MKRKDVRVESQMRRSKRRKSLASFFSLKAAASEEKDVNLDTFWMENAGVGPAVERITWQTTAKEVLAMLRT